mmetsp:Transcript_7923/g.25031  ORF Transcript_7923/g.25031 Transcript_7923/m.25031 type:complete len:381 (-) Transcript_7923:980-2122(-)
MRQAGAPAARDGGARPGCVPCACVFPSRRAVADGQAPAQPACGGAAAASPGSGANPIHGVWRLVDGRLSVSLGRARAASRPRLARAGRDGRGSLPAVRRGGRRRGAAQDAAHADAGGRGGHRDELAVLPHGPEGLHADGRSEGRLFRGVCPRRLRRARLRPGRDVGARPEAVGDGAGCGHAAAGARRRARLDGHRQPRARHGALRAVAVRGGQHRRPLPAKHKRHARPARRLEAQDARRAHGGSAAQRLVGLQRPDLLQHDRARARAAGRPVAGRVEAVARRAGPGRRGGRRLARGRPLRLPEPQRAAPPFGRVSAHHTDRAAGPRVLGRPHLLCAARAAGTRHPAGRAAHDLPVLGHARVHVGEEAALARGGAVAGRRR